MPKVSAGLIMYRRVSGGLQVLLVHPGGPVWKHKDAGWWSIPKGEMGEGEDALAAAQREFQEETGFAVREPFIELTSVQLRSGKIVHAWAFEGDCDPAALHSNTFSLEWPPRSGKVCEFPEVDRAGFFTVAEAKEKMSERQFPLVEELQRKLAIQG
ncbi:MAG: NUDIX domain-containing protein [Verrucomicrobia bacterium]|nr:NUDIX domain-containing protein [Verrucomicrobiota bacterium]